MNEDRTQMPPKEALDAMAAQLQAKNKEIVERVNYNITNNNNTEMTAVLYEISLVAVQLENLTAIVLEMAQPQEEQRLIEVPRIGIDGERR